MMPNKCSTGYGKWEPWLPPGFRFHPTDEELVTFYLAKKVQSETFEDPAIAEVDLNNCEPWDLPEMAKMGEKEWYFYTLLDKKYPTGMRTNRATRSGYWKATGKDREIMSSRTNSLLGMKKTLVFYKGRAPKGEKTNWVMHEYRLEGNYSSLVRASKGERVVCRVFQKNVEETKIPLERRTCNVNHSSVSLCSLPSLLESPPQSTNSIPFITSVSSHSDFAQPSCMHHDEGESSELTKRSSCLKLNLCSLNSRSSTIFNVAKSLDDNYSYELLNTMPQMTNDGLNSSFRAFLVDNSEAQQMDMKAIFMNTSKIQHNLNSSGFSLEEFLQGYEEPISPADNYYSKQQPQQLQVFTVASSQLSQTGDDTFVALRHVQEMADPNAFDRRLTQGTSSISECLWPC